MAQAKRQAKTNTPRPESLFFKSWLKLKKNKTALLSAGFIALMVLVSVKAPYLAPYSFDEQMPDRILLPPEARHWLGTDSLGRDLLSRLIYGGRVSMAVGILTAILSLVLGVCYGALSGWVGGRTDAFMMRAIDVLYSIPTLVLLILVKVVFDSLMIFTHPELKSLLGILVALSLVGWVSLARVVRGEVLHIKERQYVESARCLGGSDKRILLFHVLPNILGPVMVLLTFQIPANILFESFLSFLGLGLQPPYSSWGVLAAEGWQSLRSYPHLMLAPATALFLTMMAFNLLGDGLRDAMDPKSL